MPAYISRPTYFDGMKWTGSNFSDILDMFPDLASDFILEDDGTLLYRGMTVTVGKTLLRMGLSMSMLSDEELLAMFQEVPDKNQQFVLDTAT